MAKAATPLPQAAALLALADHEGRIAVRATPGARGESLAIDGDRLLARVTAAPEDGKANDAVRTLLASALGLAPSRLVLVRGATSREKLFRILP